MLKDIRAFFDGRGVIEVETPLLSSSRTPDPHLHSFRTRYQKKDYFLNTSPEYAMKRLLCEYRQAIFQLCKSFRVDELGPNHNPEFTLLEWYRPGFDMSELMSEIEQLISVFYGRHIPIVRESYQSVFERFAGFNPHVVSADECRRAALDNAIEQPVGLEDDVDEWLDWLLTQLVLPKLRADQFVFIYDYPASQSALARLHRNESGITVAARFELFYGEVELANGFHELADADEQMRRFTAENDKRQQLGYETCEPDANFLAALRHGLPDCSGVALGVDRLLMVLSGADELAEVIAYPWQRC